VYGRGEEAEDLAALGADGGRADERVGRTVGDEHAPSSDEPTTLSLESRDRDAVVPVAGSLYADSSGHLSPIGCDLCETGGAVDAPGLLEQLGRADHHLRRDAGPVGALAPEQFRLDPNHVDPGFREPEADVLARGSHPDDDHVCPVAHIGLLG